MLARTLREDALRNLAQPRPEFTADLAPADRLPRERMVAIADSYFEAIEHADGKLAPFADDCVRRENGGQTTHNATPVPWPVPLGGSQDSPCCGDANRLLRRAGGNARLPAKGLTCRSGR